MLDEGGKALKVRTWENRNVRAGRPRPGMQKNGGAKGRRYEVNAGTGPVPAKARDVNCKGQ